MKDKDMAISQGPHKKANWYISCRASTRKENKQAASQGKLHIKSAERENAFAQTKGKPNHSN
jgi:hypothetical protein